MSDEPLTGGPGRLPCGAEPVDSLAQVCDGHGAELTRHQRDCAYCRPLLIEQEQLWAPVEELAAEPVRAPSSIVEGALAHLREIADGPGGRLLPSTTPPGRTSCPGCPGSGRGWSCATPASPPRRSRVRLALSRLGARGDVAEDGTVELALTVAVDHHQDLHALAERIRTEVAAHVHALTGVRPTSVDVHIDDVVPVRS